MLKAGNKRVEDETTPNPIKSLKAITIDYDIERGKRL